MDPLYYVLLVGIPVVIMAMLLTLLVVLPLGRKVLPRYLILYLEIGTAFVLLVSALLLLNLISDAYDRYLAISIWTQSIQVATTC